MKNLFLIVLFSALAFSSVFAQKEGMKKVGVLKDGQPVLTLDKQELLKTYNKNLEAASGIVGNFTDVELIATGDKNYALVFRGKEYASSFYVIMGRAQELLAFNKVSCSTSECSQEVRGCVPKFEPNSDEGSCTECANGGKCTKTVSSSLF